MNNFKMTQDKEPKHSEDYCVFLPDSHQSQPEEKFQLQGSSTTLGKEMHYPKYQEVWNEVTHHHKFPSHWQI